mgnify:CR=1 FL=1
MAAVVQGPGKAGEWIWDLLEMISGARLTHSYVRVGGVSDGSTPAVEIDSQQVAP